MKTFLAYAWLWTLVIIVHALMYVFAGLTFFGKMLTAGCAWTAKQALDWLDWLDDKMAEIGRRA